MGLPIIATVIISPNRSFRIPTGAGRDVAFRGGSAHIVDPRDMPALLQREDAKIDIPVRSVDYIADWLNQLDELHQPKAQLSLPEGYKLGFSGTKFFLAEHPEYRNEHGRTADEEAAWLEENALVG